MSTYEMTTKKPTVGDYLRSGSCVGDPRVINLILYNTKIGL